MITQQRITPKIITPTGYMKRSFFANEYDDDNNDRKKTQEPRSEYDRANEFLKSKVSKKLRRGILCLVRYGINNNAEIFRILGERGFLKRSTEESLYGLSYTTQCIRFVRNHYGIFAKQKQHLILDLHKQGKNIAEICAELKTSRAYIKEIESEYGIKVNPGDKKRRSRTRPAWDKKGIK